MLKSLHAQNFKKHRELKIDYTAGLNVITGPNWAGKSSTLHAWLYVFFGVSGVPGGAKLVQNRDASKHKVTGVWTCGDDTFTCTRTGSTANLWKNGEGDEHLIATGTSSVNDKIEEILGMPRKDFVRIMYARQKRADQILSYGATELHQVIADVTKLEKVDRVIEKCAAKKQAAEVRLQAIPVYDVDGAKKFLRELEPRLKQAEEQLAESQVLLQKVEADLKVADDTLRATRETNATNREKIQRRDELLKEVAELNDKVTKAKDAIEQRPASTLNAEQIATEKATVTARIAAMKKTQEAWKDHDKRVTDATKSHIDAVTNLAAAKKALAEFDRTGMDVLLPDLDALKLAISEKKVTVLGQKAEVKRLSDALEQSYCPTCKREHEGASKATIEADLKAAQEALGESESTLTRMESGLQDAQKLHDRATAFAGLTQNVVTATGLLEDATTHLDGINSEAPAEPRVTDEELAEQTNKHNALIEQDKQVALEAQAVANLKDRLKDHELSRDTKLQQLKAIPENLEVKPVDDLVAKVNELTGDKNRYSDKVTDLKSGLDEMLRQRTSHEQTIADAERTQQEATELGRTIQQCKNLEKFLRTNKDNFVQEVWDNLMAYASFVADTCTSGEISRIARTPDGEFEYYENGNVFPIDAASGAQSSILGLGVQLALAEVLPCQLGTLMLDEPTADMSPEVSMALATLLSQNGSQVVMITHRDFDGLAADNSIAIG